jgi:hypothetical protein
MRAIVFLRSTSFQKLWPSPQPSPDGRTNEVENPFRARGPEELNPLFPQLIAAAAAVVHQPRGDE